jgi:hypothetical protein
MNRLLLLLIVLFFPAAAVCERRSKSAARGGVARPVEKCSAQRCSDVGQDNRGGAAIPPTESEARGVYADMEIWTEVRRRVPIGELSKRAACQEYGLNWRTLEKMLSHV